ncbi:hypothetical protein KSW81_000350 [Nannochloris sp. 'desiccata']|nr:hypothetical protein KSW81_000350 [Chlorella desiccata (nom. nud.)]
MADIHVRLINGESIIVRCTSDQINVKQLRDLLSQQKANLASCQLFRNGSIVKGCVSVGSLNLLPGEFLVALERKPREGPATASNRHSHRLLSGNDTATTALPPSEQSDGILSEEQPSSPKSDTLYSLLPGYLSRPQPSPQKPKQLLAVNRLPEQQVQIERAGDLPGAGFIKEIAKPNAPQGKTLLQLASSIDSGHRPQRPQQEREEAPAAPSTAPLPETTLSIPSSTNIVFIGNLPQEINLFPLISALSPEAIASLPLPSTALILESQFRTLCTFYEFFQRHHIQCTFSGIQQSMNNAGVMPLLTLENLEVLASLCPSVVHVSRHLSAADVPENRTDAWRDGINGSTNDADGVVELIEGGTEGGAHRAVEGMAAVAATAEDLLISLVDPWEAKYEAGGSPPIPFLEEIYAAENQIPRSTVAGTSAVALDADDTLDEINREQNGGVVVPPKTIKSSRKRKLISNKPRRMAWQLRKSLINAIVVLQERYFGDAVPPAPEIYQVQKATKTRAANTRRSKAGKQNQQRAQAQAAADTGVEAPAEVISLIDEHIEQQSTDALLQNLLKLGKWHPLFPLENTVSLSALKESTEILQTVQPPQPGSNTIGSSGGGDALDALTIAQHATTRLQQQPRKPPPSKRARKAPAAPPQLLKKHAPCTDTTHLTAPAFLKHLKSRPGYQNQIVHVEVLPARPATSTDLSPVPPPQVRHALQQRHITTLYSHQAEAITHLRSRTHTVIATSTASGKSLCYAVPIFEALVADPAACAVLIFPTKALAQDQRKNLNDMAVAAFGADTAPAVEIYDGDTPMDARASIRDKAQLILTNPDMLHLSVLPVHTHFSRILLNLKYVVVDEAHSYKGVFGCHTALVLRRLRRVCFRVYNSQPTFAVTTATVANPVQHACTLLGVPEVVLVDKDGSPHGSKEFVLWNPPLKHPELAKATGEAAGTATSTATATAVDGGLNGADKASSSRLVNKRAMQEFERSAVRAARQERNAGIMLGGPERGTEEEEEWAAAVRAGQRDPVVKAKLVSLTGSAEVRSTAAVPGKEAAPSTTLPSTSGRSTVAAAAIEPQQHQPPQQLTSRQRALISQATAAISLASGLYTNPISSLPQQHGCGDGKNNGGAGLGQRRVIKIGPRHGTTTAAAGTSRNATDDEDKMEPLPTSLSAKQSSAAKISPAAAAAAARFGSAGVDMASARTSPIVEIASLLAECVQHGLRTIAFCKTRKLSELVIAYVREILMVTAPELQTKVAVYRAGYSANERRQIEAALFSGALLGVAATNALELGGLDATLHLGFPGSIASLWQQAGRAGRSQQPSISIYVGWDGPLDQYFFKNPEKLFSRAIESALVDVSNPAALQAHAACAAYEALLDVDLDSAYYFGPNLPAAVATLQHKGILGRNFLYTGSAKNPASTITLRAIDPGKFSIIDETADNKVLEEVEETKVFYQVHDGSTYFYQGRTYLCRKLDLDAKVALVRPVDVKYYTKSVDYTAVQVIGGGESAFPSARVDSSTSSASPLVLPTSARASACTVTTRWLGFVRIWRGTGEVFDSVDLFLPDVQYETEAAYLRLPPTARRRVEAAGLPFRDGVHAAAHAVLNALPLFIMTNPEDVGTECDNPYDTRYKPERILIYDKHPGGGIGLAKAACGRFTDLLQRALSMISTCSCTFSGGCPGCIQHTNCGEYNAVLNKEAGRLVLEAALEAEAQKYGLGEVALAGEAVIPDE